MDSKQINQLARQAGALMVENPPGSGQIVQTIFPAGPALNQFVKTILEQDRLARLAVLDRRDG